MKFTNSFFFFFGVMNRIAGKIAYKVKSGMLSKNEQIQRLGKNSLK